MPSSRSDLLPRVAGAVFFTAYALYVAGLQGRDFIRKGSGVPIDDVVARAFVVLMFLLMAASYVLRLPTRVKAVGFRERYFPFFCAVLPVAVNELGGETAAGVWKTAATALLFFGNSIGVWALVYLRRSFSIMAEVRELVARGPYRFVRHPIYLGQILSTGGLLLLNPSRPSAVLYAVFVAAQIARSRFEEKKLAESLPEYDVYRKRTGAYWPRRL
jgi:protein-S-isoprenylcysteine O-methyltransferase Ste14